jgi:bifunctional non-homologous end joining protein LigD
LLAQQAVIDGEIVAVDADGRPSFQALQHRAAHPGHTIVFYAFDLLHLNGTNLTGAPLHQRRARLPDVLKESGVLLSTELPGTAQQVIQAVRSVGLEGVIAKRRTSWYTPGDRNTAWVKLKLNRQQEFVVGGYRPGPHGVDALLVGYYEGRDLRFAGKVRAGFGSATLEGLQARLARGSPSISCRLRSSASRCRPSLGWKSGARSISPRPSGARRSSAEVETRSSINDRRRG